MIDEVRLRQTVAAVYKHLKNHREILLELQIENTALKRMLQGISGDKFLQVYETYLDEAKNEASLKADALIFRLEQAVQEIQAGNVF